MEPKEDLGIQILELERLISSTHDKTRKTGLEEQLKSLRQRRKSNLKTSNRPFMQRRGSMSSLAPVMETQFVRGTSEGEGRESISEEKEIEEDENPEEYTPQCVNDVISHVTSPSDDRRHSPSCIVDYKKIDTFWISTGMFPQSIVIKMKKIVHVSRIEFLQRHIANIRVQCTTLSHKSKWQACEWKPFDTMEGGSTSVAFHHEPADAIRIEIQKASQLFCIIYGVKIIGELY